MIFSSALSCSAVANHWSAAILGFPNSFIGVMTLPVMVTIAVALLAGAKFPKWFMQAAQAGAVIGMYVCYLDVLYELRLKLACFVRGV